MAVKPYVFRVHEARTIQHPVFPSVQKHTFSIAARDLPESLPWKANAREPVGMNRRVYKDVRESLRETEAYPGTFDLMNLGITILAQSIRMISKKEFEVLIDDEDGIVNGAHTAKIIAECQEDGTVPETQYIDVRIWTGIDQTPHSDLKADIAKGQNTGIAVKDQSIFDTQGIFDSLRRTVATEPWADEVAWRESDSGKVDVRDLISIMEAFNVADYPNDGGKHPIVAYEKWSVPLQKFAKDYTTTIVTPQNRLYGAFEPLMLNMLELYDWIRADFQELYNTHVSRGAGKLRIMEEASARAGHFSFMFSDRQPKKYRLTKGAAYPILASFRNCIEYDERKNTARWIDGFEGVKDLWEAAGPELVAETAQATKDIGRMPDVLGKNRGHWANLHRTLEVRLLRESLKRVRA